MTIEKLVSPSAKCKLDSHRGKLPDCGNGTSKAKQGKCVAVVGDVDAFEVAGGVVGVVV